MRGGSASFWQPDRCEGMILGPKGMLGVVIWAWPSQAWRAGPPVSQQQQQQPLSSLLSYTYMLTALAPPCCGPQDPGCGVWQHLECLGLNPQQLPSSFVCELCRARLADPFWERMLEVLQPSCLKPQASGGGGGRGGSRQHPLACGEEQRGGGRSYSQCARGCRQPRQAGRQPWMQFSSRLPHLMPAAHTLLRLGAACSWGARR